jgi:hypothetical protein
MADALKLGAERVLTESREAADSYRLVSALLCQTIDRSRELRDDFASAFRAEWATHTGTRREGCRGSLAHSTAPDA